MGLPPHSPAGRDDANIPIPVVLIALYEFAKAGYLLFVFYSVWAPRKSGPAGGAADPLVFALPFFATVMIIAGIGLLGLQRWARHMFLLGGLLSLPWLPSLPFRPPYYLGPIVDYHSLEPFLPRTAMLAIVVIDVVVYVALMFYPDVAESFGEKGGDPFFSD
jgi:hypothetical protein